MTFNFDKIQAAFGNIRDIKPTKVNIDTKAIINSVDENAFAISELSGYFYVITIAIGFFKIKTMKGAKLHIERDAFSFTLNSDMNEFESNQTNVSNCYMTKIDFQIEEKDGDCL